MNILRLRKGKAKVIVFCYIIFFNYVPTTTTRLCRALKDRLLSRYIMAIPQFGQ